MSCVRTPETLAALREGRIEAVAEHVAGCEACGRAVTAAQLVDRGLLDGPMSDDAALAALGLGEMPFGVGPADRDFLASLVESPDGQLPLPPAFDLDDGLRPPAPITDRPSALSRPMAMIPFDEMVDPTPPPMPLAPTAVPIRRSRWTAFVAVGGALAAMLLAFVVVQGVLTRGDQPFEVPVASNEPTKLAVGGPSAAEKAAAEQAAAEKAAAEAEAKAAGGEDGEGGEAGQGGEDGEGGDEAEGDDGKEKVAAAKPSRRARRRTATRAAASPKPAAEAPKPAARRAAARKPARQKEESTSEVDDLLGALDGSGGGSKSRAAAPAAASPAPTGDPMLPEKLTKRQILTVVKRNARSITTCKDGTDASGTVPVEMVIGRAGRVTSATVASGPQKGTPVGSCIERKVRAFRFPQFSGDPMRIVMPFAL